MHAADMELVVGLKQKAVDIFTNTIPPWLPSGAQAIYGGTFLAHTLIAAQKTVGPDTSPQSMKCTFLLGGEIDADLDYHVTRLSDQPEFAVRDVRTYQNGKCLFIATVRFGASIPPMSLRVPAVSRRLIGVSSKEQFWNGGMSEACPFACSDVSIAVDHRMTSMYQSTVAEQWMRSSELLPASSKQIHHLAALAYMSDNYLLPTASRLLNIFWDRDPEYLKGGQIAADSKCPKDFIGLMLTLNHELHFHEIENFRADELMLAEMRISWIGDGRALVEMKIFSQNGVLIASAQQEGIFRLQQANAKL